MDVMEMEKTDLWDEALKPLAKDSERYGIGVLAGRPGVLEELACLHAINVVGTPNLQTIIETVGPGSAFVGVSYLIDEITRSPSAETAKSTVQSESGGLQATPRRRKASPRAVTLLEQFKDVPSVDPHLFREDLDRVLNPNL